MIDDNTALVLEGGIRFPFTVGVSADSIPVEYALRQGYSKLVAILTRNKGYRKKISESAESSSGTQRHIQQGNGSG